MFHDGQHFGAHVHNDRVRVAVRKQPGQRAVPGHPVPARIVDDQHIHAAGFAAFGGDARAGARTQQYVPLGHLSLEFSNNFGSCHFRVLLKKLQY
ncbi:hypothetical protein SDC9_197314 [bioreactor metagenome]|uniref:Uncharacterized protein n=1 Tax=bioreactor metagenome TaxID=1076179 RepID=A0A645IFU4_9ZZZZ